MTGSGVLVEHPSDAVALVRINRPEVRNALNLEVRRLLAQRLGEVAEEDTVRCIVLTDNEKAFAAGADIKEMAGAGTIDMAKQIAELPPLAIEQAKEAVLRGMDGALDTGLALEAKAIQLLFSSQDQKEGMAAFIVKRKPKFIGR